uniref:DUF4704 domain-containing protein n=1 Tax=Globisporangium ultimum (strain ATCC 200006 / CBS 805.95 / DAOM BR144) TaxID=431595 RepID=K3W509_GLOUD
MTSDDEVLFVSSGSNPAPDVEPNDGLEGYACILSVYSLESAGCFVRIYFEQATGCLRVDTGLVSSASNMNPSSKRNSAVFKNIDMNLLRASPSPSGLCDETSTGSTYAKEEDDGSHWHHVAFTHRKFVVGSSLLTLYIDGSEVTTKKLSYPSAPTMGSMQAFVGKDIQVCGTYPALPWSIGPSWFTEEALSANAIVCMFLLGPSFSGQFSGHAYRSAGDWPEAYASSQLDRATQRRVDIVRVAKRLQLTKLGRASRRVWSESGGFASATSDIASDLVGTKKDDAGDVFRFPSSGAGGSSRKEQQRVEAFQSFIKYDCAMSSFGNEILGLLSSFKLSEDLILFSLNTTCSAQSKIPVILHTQIQYVGTESLWPLDLPKVLPSVGGVTQLLLPLLENAWRSTELNIILKLLSHSMRRNPTCLSECLDMNGYALIADTLSHRIHLVDEKVLKSALRFAISGNLAQYDSPNEEIDSSYPLVSSSGSLLIVDSIALSQIVLCAEIRKILPWRLQCQLVISLRDLLNPKNPNALFNARQLRRAGFLSWVLLYLSELTNEDCSFEKTSTLERRWCFPEFAGEGYNELLQRLLSLLRAYFHTENHVDDVYAIAEMLLLSITNDSVHKKESSVRVVILQFLLHEIENDYGMGRKTVPPSSSANSNIESAELLSPTIVDAILLRTSSGGSTKKRKEKQ